MRCNSCVFRCSVKKKKEKKEKEEKKKFVGSVPSVGGSVHPVKKKTAWGKREQTENKVINEVLLDI